MTLTRAVMIFSLSFAEPVYYIDYHRSVETLQWCEKMDLSETFNISGPMVISETIENETVIIDLDQGAYYSLTGSGPFIWSLLDSPRSVSAIVDAVVAGLSASLETSKTEVIKLLSYLAAEGLISKTATEGAAIPDEKISKAKESFGTFAAPGIKKFTDMEAMLLLDPIHDVNEEGWPHPRTTAPDKP